MRGICYTVRTGPGDRGRRDKAHSAKGNPMTALAVIGEATHVGVEAHVAVNVGRLIISLIRGLDDLASLAINKVGNLAQQVSQLAGLAIDFPSELVALNLGDHAILNVDVELHNSFSFSLRGFPSF